MALLGLLLLALLAARMQVLGPTVRLRSRLVGTAGAALVLDILVVDVHRFVDFSAEGIIVGGPERCC